MDERCRTKATGASPRSRWTLIALLLGMSSACASTTPIDTIKPSNAASMQAETAMSELNEQQMSTGGNAHLMPKDIEDRLLNFIAGIKDPTDFTLERFDQELQLASRTNGSGAQKDDFVDDIPGTTWTHTLSFSKDADTATSRASYQLDNPGLHSEEAVDLRQICGEGFDAYRTKLLSMGFLEGPSMPDKIGYELRHALNHTFTRNDLVVDILSQGGSGTGQEACILGIEIWMPSTAADKE